MFFLESSMTNVKKLAKGKPGRVALIAVANKLIKQAFAIATSNRKYVSDYSKNICF
jgi:transposase